MSSVVLKLSQDHYHIASFDIQSRITSPLAAAAAPLPACLSCLFAKHIPEILKIDEMARGNAPPLHQKNLKKNGMSSYHLKKKSAGIRNEAVAQGRIAKKSSSGSTKAPTTSRKAKAASSQRIIHVFVNNRLGSRFDIPCSPSDSIGDLKKLVAVYSGTPSEMILLRRQGMKPFRNKLTLEDYEIGDGASLDLETDTTD